MRSAFIAPEAMVVLIEYRSIVSISNVLSESASTIVMSLETSPNVLYTSFGLGFGAL